MAIYHASTKSLSRSDGRSAVASVAYRAGARLTDERTGLVHDYSRRSGVASAEILTPDGGPAERSELWNAVEAAERRKDSRTGREWILALPHELDADQRRELARSFALELVRRYGVAVDMAIHEPRREDDDDNKNHHAHLFATTRTVSRSESGALVLGEKVAPELSDTKRRKLGLNAASEEVAELRGLWERLANEALERAGREERITAKSFEAQGIDREPTTHLGPSATAMERRGEPSERGEINRQAEARNAEREAVQAEIIDLKAERDRREQEGQERARQEQAQKAAREAEEARQVQEAQARQEREAAQARAQEEARQQREQERLAQTARQEAEQERLGRLSDRALEQEAWSVKTLRQRITALKPPPVEERIKDDIAVRQATNTLRLLTAEKEELEAERDRRAERIAEWRRDGQGFFGFLRGLSRLIGLSQSPGLEELEDKLDAAQQELEEGAAFLHSQGEGLEMVRKNARLRLEQEDAPQLAQAAALEAVLAVRSHETPEEGARRLACIRAEQERRRQAREAEQKRAQAEREQQALEAEQARQAQADELRRREEEGQERRRRARDERQRSDRWHLKTKIFPKLEREVRQAWREASEAGLSDHQSTQDSAWETILIRLDDKYRVMDLEAAIVKELEERLNALFDEICVPPDVPPEPEPPQAVKPPLKAQAPEPDQDEEPEPPSWSSGPGF